MKCSTEQRIRSQEGERETHDRLKSHLFRGGGIFFFLELELQISTPRPLKKPVQFPCHTEIRQNNWRKNCGKDLHSTPWFAPFYSAGVESFFSGTGTEISTPRPLKKPVQFPRYAEIRQNNVRKNCGKDLNSTPWFAPFYCLRVRGQSRDY